MGVFCQFIGLLLLLRFSNAYRHHSSPRHPIVSITKQLAFRGSSTAKANIQRHIPRSRYIKSHNYDQSLCSSRGGIPESWRDQIPDISEFLGDSSEEYFPASATTDFYLEDGMDEEIIERLRLERQLDNDRWQSCNFRDNHCGKFEGGYDLLLPIYDGDRGLSLQRIAHGECASKFTPTNWAPHGVNVSIQDTFKQESSEFVIPQGMTNLFLKEIQSTLLPSDFRTVKGIQNVGSAYSMTRIDEAGSEFITELAIRMGNCRTRVRYGYTLNNRCRSLSDDERNSNKFQVL